MISEALSSAGREVLVQCSQESACIYDAVKTGSLSLGLASLQVHNLNVADLAKLSNCFVGFFTIVINFFQVISLQTLLVIQLLAL